MRLPKFSQISGVIAHRYHYVIIRRLFLSRSFPQESVISPFFLLKSFSLYVRMFSLKTTKEVCWHGSAITEFLYF